MTPKKPKAILFDMDDTILAYEAVTDPAWQEVCGRFAPLLGREVGELYAAIDEIRKWYASDNERHRYMRLNLIAYRREVAAMAFEKLGIIAPELAITLADSYGVVREAAVYPVPGAIDTLRLCKRECRLALITNGSSDLQRRKIVRFALAPMFDYILVEGEFGVGKPDARVFSHVLEKLGVTADEAVMVGDDLERDIGGAQAVGISGIWVDWRGSGLPNPSPVQPSRIIKSIAELL